MKLKKISKRKSILEFTEKDFFETQGGLLVPIKTKPFSFSMKFKELANLGLYIAKMQQEGEEKLAKYTLELKDNPEVVLDFDFEEFESDSQNLMDFMIEIILQVVKFNGFILDKTMIEDYFSLEDLGMYIQSVNLNKEVHSQLDIDSISKKK